MKTKPSELFEGKNSALRKTYDKAVKKQKVVKKKITLDGSIVQWSDRSLNVYMPPLKLTTKVKKEIKAKVYPCTIIYQPL